ncbi:glycosyltransferase family 2 protein [Pseudarthrobacter sulfonivorans]|uniref:glycosyltransferase family 2 protein n=1 Tax=Pseudarthrobacter sulfonivorans TaxID=121292 RepID=UPI0028604919|nr:glycosyltransferase family 2 protein [Pseudarthrobacter sulfonivorans]MDR6414876.1 glycosyltransferase involved in cell wall biosynthesis [Pseudarthrobacter sulfonivorans]
MEKLPISVLVQTKNEEVGIEACLMGLGDFSEVIVVDSDSTDRTVEISSSLGFSIVNFTWNGEYPKKKQWQLDNVVTKHEWILFIDADEVPTHGLLQELRSLIPELQAKVNAAYDIPLDYVFAGRILKHGHRVFKRALVNRALVAFPVIDDLAAPGMGELEGHYQPTAIGNVPKLLGRILHDDKDPVRTWFERHNRYSEWEAFLRTHPAVREAAAQRRTPQGRLFDKVPFKPLFFFLYSYLGKHGFRDGRPGFDYAFALASYYWQIGLKVREIERTNILTADQREETI